MKNFVTVCTALTVLMSWAPLLPAQSGQEQPTAIQQETAALAAREEPAQPKELSVYGEVQSVNVPSNSISVQYYDYDSDQEKAAEITLDKNTKIENVTGIDKIAKGDWVDVIYAVRDAKNVAVSLVVEKEELQAPVVAADAPAPSEE